jgi:hypothetical protein
MKSPGACVGLVDVTLAVALAVVATGGGCGGGSLAPTMTGTAGSGGDICQGTRLLAQQVAPDILIVLDTSTSMNDAIDASCTVGCQSRWTAASAGINTVVDATATLVNWGLSFEAGAGATGTCETGGVVVPAGSASEIRSALASRTTAGGAVSAPGNRPTRAAVQLAGTYLSGTNAPEPVILLIGDGAPDCGPGVPDLLTDDTTGTVAAVQQGFVPTFVVGLAASSGPADDALGQIAVAGGFARAASPTYYPASSSGELVAAMNVLVEATVECTFAVPPPPTSDGTTSRGQITLVSDSGQIDQDPMNGWTYASQNMTAVHLHGSSCDAVRNGTARNVTIVFQCFSGGP